MQGITQNWAVLGFVCFFVVLFLWSMKYLGSNKLFLTLNSVRDKSKSQTAKGLLEFTKCFHKSPHPIDTEAASKHKRHLYLEGQGHVSSSKGLFSIFLTVGSCKIPQTCCTRQLLFRKGRQTKGMRQYGICL